MYRYNEFKIIRESKENIISIADIESLMKEVFSDTKVYSIKNTYEKSNKQQLLIITLNNVFYDETGIILTKLIFYVDDLKQKITDYKISYLYEINDVYKNISFENIDDLKLKISDIFKKNKFGDSLQELSLLSVSLSSRVNEYLTSADNVSVYNISYKPKVDNIPSDKLIFNFVININNSDELDMNIKKISDGFEITFNSGDWFDTQNIPTLKALPQTISDVVKKRYS